MRRQPGFYAACKNSKAVQTLTPTRPAAPFCKQMFGLRAHHCEAQVQRAVGGFVNQISNRGACLLTSQQMSAEIRRSERLQRKEEL